MIVYPFALLQLARAATWRGAWYSGLVTGFLVAAPKLAFFFRIFSGGAAALWTVYAIWIALFVVIARLCLREFGPKWGWLPTPFLWLGLEYFRSELYYLRFSWLNAGYAFADATGLVPLRQVGMYGVGFVVAVAAAFAAWSWSKSRVRALTLLIAANAGIWVWGSVTRLSDEKAAQAVHIVGVQMEFPPEREVLLTLDGVVRKYPETEVVVLSEYTFQGKLPETVKQWCRDNRRYLVVGGEDPAPGGDFYNTAFVIGPSGDVVFRQVKSVPIQFFKDGRPAPEQKVWESPWGKIGICICYDLSYTRVTDRLIELGAQALIVPTMDVSDWGEDQHKLHARVAPVRAAEYGVPIFRLASSGISQWVGSDGRVRASAPFPGDEVKLVATLTMAPKGTLPLDRWLGPISAGVTGFLILRFVAKRMRKLWQRKASLEQSDSNSSGQIGDVKMPAHS